MVEIIMRWPTGDNPASRPEHLLLLALSGTNVYIHAPLNVSSLRHMTISKHLFCHLPATYQCRVLKLTKNMCLDVIKSV